MTLPLTGQIVRAPPSLLAALGRLRTRNLGVAFAVVVVAFTITLIPFGIRFFENSFKGASDYQSFVGAIEEFYFGLLAITVSSILNFVEGQDGRSLGRVCAALTVVSFLCTIISLVGYSFAHFLKADIFDPKRDGGGFAFFTLIVAAICITVSMVNILEARRMKDRLKEFES
jgi:hypothetical protein